MRNHVVNLGEPADGGDCVRKGRTDAQSEDLEDAGALDGADAEPAEVNPSDGVAEGVATLSQVARASGVSTSTVSRYLRGQLAVSPSTRRSIDEAVRSLNYLPQERRRSASTAPNGVIGLVLPGLSNAFFAALADSIADEVALLGCSLVLCTTRDVKRREEAYTELLEAQQVDGMLYLGAHASNRRLAAVIRRGLPVVVVDEPQVHLPPVATLTVDNFTGGYQGTAYLLGMGHTDIAYLGGPSGLETEKERRRGYTEALARNGVPLAPEHMFVGGYSQSFGVSALPHLLEMDRIPTAAFCASDETALGLMAAARNFGLELPRDLSIVGFDDTIAARYTTPPLSSIHQPVSEIAKNAVEMLAARMDNGNLPPETRTLPVELVVRESVARRSADGGPEQGDSQDRMGGATWAE